MLIADASVGAVEARSNTTVCSGALLDAYLARTQVSFAAAQQAADAGRAIADAATSDDYRFRWQTSEAAERFAGISLADLDGSRVHGVTAGWIASS